MVAFIYVEHMLQLHPAIYLHGDEGCSSNRVSLDNLCHHTCMLGCVHEQNVHSQQWIQVIGVANKNAVFAILVGLTIM